MGSECDMAAFNKQADLAAQELGAVMARIQNGEVLIGITVDVTFEQVGLGFQFETGQPTYVDIGNNPDYDYPADEEDEADWDDDADDPQA